MPCRSSSSEGKAPCRVDGKRRLRVWLPPELYERILRESAVRGVSLSRCVRDRLEAHFGLEEELLDIVERKDVPSVDQATGTALRLRLLDELDLK